MRNKMTTHRERAISIPIEKAADFARGYVWPIIASLIIPYAWVKLGNKISLEEAIRIYSCELVHAILTGEGILKTLFLPLRFILTPFNDPVWFGIALLLGIPVHELLHALAAISLSGKGFKTVSFGFSKQAMAPYTHFKEPLKIWQYRIVLALPGIVLGIIPAVVAIIISQPEWMIFAFFYLFGALGDYMMLKILKKFPANQSIKDHPKTLGFILID